MHTCTAFYESVNSLGEAAAASPGSVAYEICQGKNATIQCLLSYSQIQSVVFNYLLIYVPK